MPEGVLRLPRSRRSQGRLPVREHPAEDGHLRIPDRRPVYGGDFQRICEYRGDLKLHWLEELTY